MDSSAHARRAAKEFGLTALVIVVVTGLFAWTSAEANSRRNAQLQQQVLKMQRIAAAEPARFASYRMASLQCMRSRTALVAFFGFDSEGQVHCDVENSQGQRVDFSREFARVMAQPVAQPVAQPGSRQEAER